jgi:ATP-binding cassette subfamily B protein
MTDGAEPQRIEGVDDEDDDFEDEGPAASNYSAIEFMQSVVAGQFAKKPLRRLPRVIRQAVRVVWQTDPRRFVLVTAISLVTGTGVAFQLLAGRNAFAAVLAARARGHELSTAFPSLIRVGVISLVLAALTQLRTYNEELLRVKVTRASTDHVLDAATKVDLRKFEDPQFFDHLQRARDAGSIGVYQVVGGVTGTVASAIGALGLVGALLAIEPILVPLVLVSAVPLVLISRNLTRKSYEFRVWQTPGARERAYLQQLMTGRDEAKEIRAFNLRDHLHARYDRLYDEYEAENRKMARARSRSAVLSSSANQLAAGVTLGILVWLLFHGRLDVAGATAAGFAVQQLSGRVQMLAGGVGGLYDGTVFLDDWATFTELEPEGQGRATPPAHDPQRIEVEEISFTYPGATRPALVDVSMHIERGEIIALVGENGSGKTTLAKLLCQLYPPDQGRVLWDGVDTAGLSPQALREPIAAIFQDFARYQLPARDNVGMGRSERIGDLDAIRESARLAGADRFLRRLPDGYDTPLSKAFRGGRDLSVGQWQRVALARAFFRDAPFVVLDEPTASLDPRAEHQLFDSIRSLYRGKSVLLISHRFSSVRSADRIYVLDKGRVVEHGTHRELMANQSLYAELFTLQAAAYVD